MKTLLFFLMLISFPAYSQTALVLGLGEQKSVPLQGQDRVWIQDREILTAEGQGSKLNLVGRREGVTTVKVGSALYSVQVLHPSKKDSFQDLSVYLKSRVGLRASLSEGDLLIEGQLYRLQDWIHLAEYMRSKSLNYQMRARMTASLQQQAQEHFSDLFYKAHLPPQTLIYEPALEIRVSGTDQTFKKYSKLLMPYGVGLLKDETSLDVAPTIKVQITVAEIKKDFSLKYGLRPPAGYSAKLMPDGVWERDELPFNLTALEAQGHGKILASPNILCRSGKEAEFLAGGEFPIKIMNYKMQDIVWKRYGILLRVKPKADAAGRMSISIETEISTVDDSRKVDDVPGILTNRVSSHFDLTRPQTIALSGLLKSEDGKSSEGLPLLSRLPVVGALFSSKDFKENRSELVIFVRPSILREGEENPMPHHLNTLQGRRL
ncbi:pilus assembly protein [Bdellovibrio bacteriovorus]|uniref:pilus assembly protein n=1 Tax=Bdellovibrio bacteriovorus TaxID=959 RepID=UPI0035A70BFA